MNAARRKRIDELLAVLETLKGDIDTVLGEEQDAFDNLPESVQSSGKGEAAQEKIDALQEAFDRCDEISADLEKAKE